MSQIKKLSFYKNPFIGLFIKSSEKLTLIPKNIHEKNIPQIEDALQAKVIPMFICQSPTLGIFCALNSNGIVVSALAEKHELKPLKDEGLNICYLDERFSPGNNILTNDNAALVNPSIPKVEIKRIADCLGVEVSNHPIANLQTVGSTNIATNSGLLANNDISDVELKMLERIFKVRGLKGTVNLGSLANSYGVVANTKGAIVGEATSGSEMQRIYESLFG
ncbi:translation initiation factor IF-6 [Candidatus Micrarchaeota archaeon]|nr:translation initiation factor IF-6 [Candidatus Micrarchaeota archaeon]